VEEQDVATGAFLTLFRWLRTVILQDAVFLRPRFPHSPIWQHPIFASPLFEQFAQQLSLEAKHGEEPRMAQINKILPDLGHVLQSQVGNLHTSVNTLNGQMGVMNGKMEDLPYVRKLVEEMKQDNQPMIYFMRLFIENGGFNMDAHINSTITLPGFPTRTMQQASSSSIATGTAALNVASQQTTSAQLEPDTEIERRRINNDNNNIATLVPTITGAIAACNNAQSAVPQYHLQPWIKTVEDCWQEYDEGICPGPLLPRGPAIRELDQQHGAKWRQHDSIRKSHARRKNIWEAVIQISKDYKKPPKDIAILIDKWRRAQKKPVGLQTLNQMLADVKKGKIPPIWESDHRVLLEFFPDVQ